MKRIKTFLSSLKTFGNSFMAFFVKNYVGFFFAGVMILLTLYGSHIITKTQAIKDASSTTTQTDNSSLLLDSPTQVKYNDFLNMVKKQQVASAILDNTSAFVRFTTKENKNYITDNPRTANFKEFLLTNNVDVTESNPYWGYIISFLILSSVLLCFYFYSKGKGRKVTKTVDNMGLGQVKNVEAVEVPDITFDDIAGNQTIKKDVQFIIDFLQNPDKYLEIGARLPKGVIFYGPPGTGKTLCAKAIAGEAGVPFFSACGSDFVEMYVGVGAKRVRALFEEAQKQAPAIIFIDELDAVAKKRGMDSHSERDQTINALLTELDGFGSTEGIVVIGATNRLELLDEALTRPGRFDKSLAIPLPEFNERVDILKLHAQNKKLSPSVDLTKIAQTTIGFSGAGLETLLNESAIIAVNKDHFEITMEDIDDAYYKIIMKGDRKSTKDIKEEQLRLVAWHEAGHALVAKLLTKKSVPKVSIVPSTSGAGGVTFIIPDKNGLHTKRDIINDIKISYGGRIGEYLLTKSDDLVTTGASQDIRQATDSIIGMIKEFGMNDEMGMLYVEALDGNDPRVNQEAKRIAKEIYQETLNLLQGHEKTLETIVNRLLLKESLEEEELDEIITNQGGE